MPLLYLDALPPRTTKGTIVRLLTQVGGIDRQLIGAIEIHGRTATVEIPDRWLERLATALDGANLANQFVRAWTANLAARDGQEDHFQRLARLLELEAKAEAEQARAAARRLSPADAESSGNTLTGLVIRDACSGLGGRVLLTLTQRDATRRLPWTRLAAGSPVLLSEESASSRGSAGWRGVVCQREASAIQVAFQQYPEPAQGSTFRLDLTTDEIARQRQRQALERARLARGSRLAELRAVLMGQRSPGFAAEKPAATIDPLLNPAQCDAVRFALSAEHVAVIHGPPGTGKTTAVVELIRQAIARGHKVLACAPSNLAVDNIFERLLAAGANAVRLGHPARVSPELRERTLDLMVDAHDDVRLARKLIQQAGALRARASRFTRSKPAPGARREWRAEARLLVEDALRLETQVVQQILDSAAVLCTTLTALDSEVLGQREFDWAVIDEACQSTEPACWIPLLRSQRVVLAGDHCQLPPTVVSPQAARAGLGVSLLQRLATHYGEFVVRRLTTQYRMHEQIMAFSSQEFYDESLVADRLVRCHLLCDLPDIVACRLTETPLHFIDTAGAGFDEQQEAEGESRLNPREVELASRLVRQLLDAGVAARGIAVITPYAAQVRLLRQTLDSEGVEVDSVDGFQGREKEAVVISLVRSNPRGEIGFLADVRRMNVALTRARRKLIVIGDSATISAHPFYVRMLEHFEAAGAYRSVWECEW